MRQTVKQYIAALRRYSECPGDMKYQVDAWPYPQADDSHIKIWRSAWQDNRNQIPRAAARVDLLNSDRPGVLLRVADYAPSPSDVAVYLAEGV